MSDIDTGIECSKAAVQDAAVFGYTVYSQGAENVSQTEDVARDVVNEEKKSLILNESCFCSKEDFVVLAEFSEVTGPIPLLTVPSNALSYSDVDVNTLIMKIMSVDYQANPSGQFAFCKDVQVLQNEVLPGLHAYVHYCTLNDLRARGFVRPLCFAYVSADLIKLQNKFDTLREKFLSAVEILKYDNRQTFINEISKIMSHLKQTQNQYFILKKKEEDEEYLSPEERKCLLKTQLDQLAHQHTELQNMLLIAEQLQDCKDTETAIAEWQNVLERSRDAGCERFLSATRRAVAVSASSGYSTAAASVGPPSLRETLRPVVALAPWGIAAALWRLLLIQRMLRKCRLKSSLHMFTLAEENVQVNGSPSAALSDLEFLQLLSSTASPFQWPDSQRGSLPASPPVEVLSPESLEYMEANLITSGNEASSSYHSATESLSEVMIAARQDEVSDKHSASIESFLEAPSDSDSSEDPPMDDESESNIVETWSSCAWSTDTPIGNIVAGKRILKFFQRYPRAALHVLYSLLMGRTVVLAGGETFRSKVRTSLEALTALVPTSPNILWWHRGILVSSHVSSHRLIGMCVPERLSVHDMISPRDKNLVTILEVASGRLWGPAYSGRLLSNLEVVPTAVTSDHMLLLLLQSIAEGMKEKLFVLKLSSRSVSDSLSLLDVTGSDSDILKYLIKTEVNFLN